MNQETDPSTIAHPPVPVRPQLPESRRAAGMTWQQYMASPVVQGLGAAGLALAFRGLKAILTRRERRGQVQRGLTISIQAVQITIWTRGDKDLS